MDSEYWQSLIPRMTEGEKDLQEENAKLVQAIFTPMLRELYKSPIEEVIDIPEVI